jgi:hypothetical protein
MALRSLDTPRKFPSPKTILRISTLSCLVASVLSALVGRGTQGLARGLSGFFIIPFLLFGLFYLEYALVEAMVKRELDFRFGYLQAFGCWAITLFVTLAIAFAKLAGTPPPGIQENALLLMGVFGEIVFVGNVVWTYLHEAGLSQQRPAFIGQRSRTPAKKVTRNSGWPESPAKVFGIAAAFFLVMGGILVAVRPLGSRLPVQWHGHVSQVAAGYLWISTAAPFSIFALVYWVIEYLGKRVFEIPPTKIHFICTVLVVAEGVREYISWASSWANPSSLDNPETASQFSGAFALALMVAVSFGWNLWTSRRV